MRTAELWQDYELIDCAEGERLERWGEVILIRPDPQVIWGHAQTRHPLWAKAHARYLRSSSGGGHWERLRPCPEEWHIAYRALRFAIKPMGFKHTGLFPEQAVNWDACSAAIASRAAGGERVRVLNLFAYTGGATAACLAVGAHVTHVDAARGMVQRAKENACLSGLSDRPVRWIVEDCLKFAQRELRRGSRYDVILMDPPSYGRGPGGEVWQLERELDGLAELCAALLQPNGMLLLNAYSAALSPSVMQYLLGVKLQLRFGGTVSCEEIGLPVSATGLVLPCGSTAIWAGNTS